MSTTSIVGAILLAGLIALAVWQRVSVRRVVRAMDRHRRQEDLALRKFWQVSADFSDRGWARADLERLRLLCRNVESRQLLSERLALRIKTAATHVVAGVLDRLEDLSRTGRQLDLSPRSVERIEAGSSVLIEELVGTEFTAGVNARFDPQRVSEAIDGVLEACERLRSGVSPRIAADTSALMNWLTKSKFARLHDTGRLVVDARVGDSGRVAVRATDLVEALDELLSRALEHDQIDGTVHVEMVDRREGIELELDCRVIDRFRLSPSSLVAPLRKLTAYGVRVQLEEELEQERIRIRMTLPKTEVELPDNVSPFERAV